MKQFSWSFFVLILAVFSHSWAFAQLGPSFRAPSPLKEWTVLVYINGDNNLWPAAQRNFAEMEKVGSSDQVNIVAQVDPEPVGLPTNRYFVTRNPNPVVGKPSSPVVDSTGEVDSGDWRTLSQFLIWGAKNFPAKHYAVVVWNHGNGWQGISYDDNPVNHITMPALRQGLEVFNRFIAEQRGVNRQALAQSPAQSPAMIDILNFDACLMSAIEVAYEIKDQVKILVGSQFLEPDDGEDYTALLQPLIEKPGMSAEAFAQNMVYQYVSRFSGPGHSDINYAAIDLRKVQGFTRLVNDTAEAILRTSPEIRRAILRKLENPESGGFDLIGAMQAAQSVSSKDPALAAVLENLIQVYGYPKDAMDAGHGLTPALGVIRYSPGVVRFRNSPNDGWKSVPMVRLADGRFGAKIPVSNQLQYLVTKPSGFARTAASHEALSSFHPTARGEFVFHTSFPESSPLLVDAYNLQTRGAHGVTLYSLASAQFFKKGNPLLAQDMVSRYGQLLFAKVGAPAWSKLFGW